MKFKNYLSACIFFILGSCQSNSDITNNMKTQYNDDSVIISPYSTNEDSILRDANSFFENLPITSTRSGNKVINYDRTEVSDFYKTIPITSDMTVSRSVKSQKIPIYIINYKTQNGEPAGFVIKAGDSRTNNMVLAFSDKGEFRDIEEMETIDGGYFSERIGLFLMSTIENVPDDEIMQNLSKTVTTRSARQPLLNTSWHYLPSPYNDFLPFCTDDMTNRVAAGCTAVAMAQIMAYHKWPERGCYTDRSKSPLSRGVLAGTPKYVTYSYWDEIQQTYNAANLTDSRYKEHVANLMAETSLRLGTKFECSVGNTSPSRVPNVLKSMGYQDAFIREASEKTFHVGYIIDDLKANRPVFMAAYKPDNTGGHAFVADGFMLLNTSSSNSPFDCYIHFVYGNGGYMDGYYYVDYWSKTDPILSEAFEYTTNPIIVYNIMKDPNNNGARNPNTMYQGN